MYISPFRLSYKLEEDTVYILSLYHKDVQQAFAIFSLEKLNLAIGYNRCYTMRGLSPRVQRHEDFRRKSEALGGGALLQNFIM